MKRWGLYLGRMVIFVSSWTLLGGFLENSSPLRRLPIGILTWVLWEVLMAAWNRFMRNRRRESHQ